MRKITTALSALAIAGTISTADASTFFGDFTLTAPKGVTDVHIQFNGMDGESLTDLDFHGAFETGVDTGFGYDAGENQIFAELGPGTPRFSGGEQIRISFKIEYNDIFNPLIVDAWWTNQDDGDAADDYRWGPDINWRSMVLTQGSTPPGTSTSIPNVPLPAAGILMLAALGGLGLSRMRRGV